MRYAHEYVNSLCENTSYPIFTIPVLFGKVYVVSSPLFVQAVFRNKKLSFTPFVVEFVHRMDDLSVTAKQAYAEGLHTSVMQLFASRMNGARRKRMAAVALQELARLLPPSHKSKQFVNEDHSDTPTEDLWLWLRAILTISTTSSLLGKENNPWNKIPSLVESYWAFEAGSPTGRTSLLDVTYRNSKNSHDAMVDALEAYFAAEYDVTDHQSDKSFVAALTADTAAIQREYGFGAREIAATYVTIVHGALVNMVPTLFWCVAHVFSRPLLLARLREELITAMIVGQEEVSKEKGNTRAMLVDAEKIETSCPLLLSVVQETQRLVAIGTLHRRVLEDTTVSSDGSNGQEQTYTLKKGTSILLPVAISHRNPLIWGPTAHEFDADRFVKSQSYHTNNVVAEEHSKDTVEEDGASACLRKVAYFPFGGGRELCPGRYFATTEVLGTMTMLVLGYNIIGVDGEPMKQPKFGPSKMTAATARPHPDADLRVKIERRQGWEDTIWEVKNLS